MGILLQILKKKLCIRYPFAALKSEHGEKNIATSKNREQIGMNGLGDRK